MQADPTNPGRLALTLLTLTPNQEARAAQAPHAPCTTWWARSGGAACAAAACARLSPSPASGSGSLVSVSVCVGCRALSTEVQVSIWQVFAPAGSVFTFFLSFPPRTLKLACGESTTALKLPAGDKADSAAKPRSPRMTHGASLQNVSTHRTDLYPHRSMRTLGR